MIVGRYAEPKYRPSLPYLFCYFDNILSQDGLVYDYIVVRATRGN